VTLRIGSLCSGFGGLDMSVMDVLDAEVAWHCQYDPDDKHQYAAQILAHHWPDVPNHGDITSIDWTQVEPVDILTAGFPCQPVSNAGKRKGHEDDRWLWPDVASAIRVLRPRLVLLENVAALVGRGLDRVLAGLAEIGFDAEWTCLRASDVGAAHRRERIFILAWPAADAPHLGHERDRAARFRRTGLADGRLAPADSPFLGHRNAGTALLARIPAAAIAGAAADADNSGAFPEQDREPYRPEAVDEHEVVDAPGRVLDWGPYGPAIKRWGHVMMRPAPAPTEPGKTGPRLAPRFVEWLMGCPEGHITDVPGIPRNAQLKASGNGVVRQQGAEALRRLLANAPAWLIHSLTERTTT
jgi:DNA (cytosine-5)-methyltransferase 1